MKIERAMIRVYGMLIAIDEKKNVLEVMLLYIMLFKMK